MIDSDFIGYVLEPDVHDGVILEVRGSSDPVRVLVRTQDDRLHAIEFHGVRSVRAHQPEGMMLYSLSEMAADPPLRRFVFTDWDESGERFLEVTAAGVKSHEVAGEGAF